MYNFSMMSSYKNFICENKTSINNFILDINLLENIWAYVSFNTLKTNELRR